MPMEPGGTPNRRHFLRGLGACVALPVLASLRPLRLLAAEATSAAKLGGGSTGMGGGGSGD